MTTVTNALQPTDTKESPVLRTALSDVVRGFVTVTHSGAALLGIALAAMVITLSARSDLRADLEENLLDWLQQRQEAPVLAEPVASADSASERTNAVLSLPKAQAAVTQWLSRKYRVAHEPLGNLVAEAFKEGERSRLDPTLILAVMAIESRFNPYAQSPVGAQGLMQVLTRVHADKYANYGGNQAAFDPLSNLRVGVKVLKDCIRQAGSIEGGLGLYVGAVTTDASGYINKVMAEHLRIQSVALGKPMPTTFPVYVAQRPATAEETVAPADTQTGLVNTQQTTEPAAQPATQTAGTDPASS